MRAIRFLAILPFIGILGGIVFANRVTPYVFGLPFVLGWLVMWVAATAVIMGAIYLADPANHAQVGERDR